MLFGRESEIARIEDGLRAARRGTSRVLVIRGEAGIGKSALMQYARECAAGMRLLQARGVEAESDLPFAGLTDLLGPVIDLASGLPSAPGHAVRGALALESSSGMDRFAVGVGTLGLLAAAADERPVLALVEDLPWFDSASAEALAFAARRLRAEAIAVIVSCRSESTTPLDADGFEELVLEGLDVQAAGCLIAERAGGPAANTALERLVAATGGNPLALIELTRVLTAGQLAGMAALPDPLPARGLAERLFAKQIAALDQEAQRALLLAAAAGEGAAGPVLAAAGAIGLPAAVFERVEAKGLFSFVDGRLSFRHPLARSAAYAAARRASAVRRTERSRGHLRMTAGHGIWRRRLSARTKRPPPRSSRPPNGPGGAAASRRPRRRSNAPLAFRHAYPNERAGCWPRPTPPTSPVSTTTPSRGSTRQTNTWPTIPRCTPPVSDCARVSSKRQDAHGMPGGIVIARLSCSQT